ncbi:major capsid protein [Caulobacter sp. 1776]|uniref:major capsid protein n=1 Tax=Caulobacter sp. 1776 TaxID=3156420 RepID=UPI003390F738
MEFTLLDVFKSSLFTSTSLAAKVDRIPYVPQVLAQLGIFEEDGVSTTSMYIERRHHQLALVPAKPRGAPGTPITGPKRDGIQLEIPHLPLTAHITPDELQNVRGFGTPGMLVGVQEKRDEKLEAMSRNHDLTLEYHRLGAIGGVILDANGDVLIDLYDKFEIDQPDDIELELDDAYDPNDPAKAGAIRKQITGATRKIRDALGGVAPKGFVALCGDDYFDKLTNHPEVNRTYLNQTAANDLREGDPIEKVKYGNVTHLNYRGWGNVAVPTDECRYIPIGVPGLFLTRFAPGPLFSAVNTKGKPKYVVPSIDKTGEKEIELEMQSNPINICTRPDCLFTGKIAA